MKIQGLRHQGKRAPGQAYTEFALVLPLLLILILVIVDLGRITYTYSTLHNAAREGARFGAVNFNWANQTGIINRTKEYAVGLNRDPSALTVTVTLNDTTEPYTIKVEAAYKFQTASPILYLFSGSNAYTLKTRSIMVLEYIIN